MASPCLRSSNRPLPGQHRPEQHGDEGRPAPPVVRGAGRDRAAELGRREGLETDEAAHTVADGQWLSSV